MWYVVGASGEVEEACVLEALNYLRWKFSRRLQVSVAGRGLVIERYLVLHGGGGELLLDADRRVGRSDVEKTWENVEGQLMQGRLQA